MSNARKSIEQTTRGMLCRVAAVLVDEDTHPEYVRGIVELIAYWTEDDHLDGDIDGTIKDVLNRIERKA